MTLSFRDEKSVFDDWQKALDYWGTSIQLSNPIDLQTIKEERPQAIAFIKMTTRQVFYDRGFFDQNKISDCLSATFAHEIGHHIKFPSSKKTSADLMILAEEIIPGLPYYHINIFWDLLVNEFVGRDPDYREQLKKIYQAATKSGMNDYFKNYLAIYESIWRCEGYFKLQMSPEMQAYAGEFAETFYQLPTFHEQFIYFLSHFIILFPLEDLMKDQASNDPFSGDAEQPEPTDFPADGKLSGQSQKAMNKAQEKGWFKHKEAFGNNTNDWRRMANILNRLPGTHDSHALKQAAYRFYRNYVEKLIDLMPKKIKAENPDSILPSVLEDWDSSDDVQSINWTESYLKSGHLAPAFLLKREMIPDDPSNEEGFDKPKIEIYLDTSGSMPAPENDINMMTISALLLATYSIRKKGIVRGTIFSVHTEDSDWIFSESKAIEFFLQYVGGGTQFPFHILQQRTADEKKVHRVIISDSDFMYNIHADLAGCRKTLLAAVENSLSTTFLLHLVQKKDLDRIIGAEIVSHKNFRFISVNDMKDFGNITAKLARAIFGDL